MGSGKDTVGLMVQYLTDRYAIKDKLSFTEWLEEKEKIESGLCYTASDWEIRKYADKLKDIVCLLIGCTREQLEDQDFKNTVLPEMWDKYAVELYDKIEYIGSQEDANKVFEHYVLKLKIDSGRIQVKKIHLTPRLVLQQLGTDCGRDIIHTNIWVNSLFADYKPIGGKMIANPKPEHLVYPSWIITDMRFPNELSYIKDRGGITIRVNRDTGVQWATSDGANEHPSETALDNAEFDYVINNDGSLEDLILSVAEILKKEGVIT
jgi:hypothetical protein